MLKRSAQAQDKIEARARISEALAKGDTATAQKMLTELSAGVKPSAPAAVATIRACGFYPHETRLKCVLDIKRSDLPRPGEVVVGHPFHHTGTAGGLGERILLHDPHDADSLTSCRELPVAAKRGNRQLLTNYFFHSSICLRISDASSALSLSVFFASAFSAVTMASVFFPCRARTRDLSQRLLMFSPALSD